MILYHLEVYNASRSKQRKLFIHKYIYIYITKQLINYNKKPQVNFIMYLRTIHKNIFNCFKDMKFY